MPVIELPQGVGLTYFFDPRRTVLFALVSTTASWAQWRSRIRTQYNVWTNASIYLEMGRNVRNWTLIVDIGNSKLPTKIGIFLPLHPFMVLSVLTQIRLGLKNVPGMLQREIYVLLMRVQRQLLFYNWTICKYFHVPQIYKLIIFEKCWRYYTTWAWHWSWIYANLSRTLLTMSDMSFALSASKY